MTKKIAQNYPDPIPYEGAQWVPVVDGKRLDGRTREAKRFIVWCEDLVADMGGDPSSAERALIQRSAGLIVAAERLEGAIATGQDADLDSLVKLTNTLNRTLQALGLKRQPRDVTPSRVIDQHAAAVLGGDGR